METSGPLQVGEKRAQRIQSVDKWETSLKSRGQRIQSVAGDKREKSAIEIMRTKEVRASRVYWETSGDKLGDKPEITRAENPV